MTQPLPIGDTLNEAFMFGVKRWGTVLRMIFAPLLIAVLIVLGYVGAIIDFEAAQASSDPESWAEFKELFRVSPAAAFVGLMAIIILIQVFVAGAMASVYRLVALGEERPGFFQIRLDGPAVRTFVAYFIYSSLGFAVFGASFLAAAAITSANPVSVIGDLAAFFFNAMQAASERREISPSDIAAMGDSLGMFALAGALSIIPLIYINTRLAPFVPGTAAENRLLLFGSFALTEGRFWSVFGVFFLLALLMTVINTVVQIVFAIIEMLMEMLASLGGGAAAIGVLITLIYIVAALVYQAFVMGVQLSAQAIVYRRLKTGS